VQQIAAAGYHSLALQNDGTAKAWGLNSSGQLGDTTITDRTSPISVVELPAAKLIAAGEAHSCAVTRDELVLLLGRE
jgi:alpha-tubulin suppressor-like RCC1 family protein